MGPFGKDNGKLGVQSKGFGVFLKEVVQAVLFLGS